MRQIARGPSLQPSTHSGPPMLSVRPRLPHACKSANILLSFISVSFSGSVTQAVASVFAQTTTALLQVLDIHKELTFSMHMCSSFCVHTRGAYIMQQQTRLASD
jgi:hypothetical protein